MKKPTYDQLRAMLAIIGLKPENTEWLRIEQHEFSVKFMPDAGDGSPTDLISTIKQWQMPLTATVDVDITACYPTSAALIAGMRIDDSCVECGHMIALHSNRRACVGCATIAIASGMPDAP